jgi:hypothetical protein
MNRVTLTFKSGLIAGAAMFLSAVAAPALAQKAPPGSYLRSCENVRTEGDRLVADCRRTDGSWGRTALHVNDCVGGIANMDGRLTCNRAGRGYDRGSGYGSSYGPQGGYGR